VTGQPQAFHRAFIVATAFAVGGCATPPADLQARAAYDEANDPLEPTNRRIFEFNRVLDGLLIKNIAILYTTVVPERVRTSLRNALTNLNEPVVFANNVLQARLNRAGTTAARFTINSTAGLAGLFDVATDWGYPEQTGDFGQTLYSWGTPEGPYLMIPVLGPTNPRDGIGQGIDGHFDPFRFLAKDQGWAGMTEARFAAAGLDERAQALPKLDEIEKTSIDFYAQIRSLYRQNRAHQLEGKVTSPALNEDFYDDPAKPAGQP
jgi:phospholipid-binding lipoprotein MlaA